MKSIILTTTIVINSMIGMAQVNWQVNRSGAAFARQGGETPEGTFRFTIGGYEVFTIQSSDKSFQPVSLYYGENNADRAKVDAMAPDGEVSTAMNCFVVKTSEGFIMFHPVDGTKEKCNGTGKQSVSGLLVVFDEPLPQRSVFYRRQHLLYLLPVEMGDVQQSVLFVGTCHI